MNRTTDSMLLERLPDDDAMRELYARYSRLAYSTCLGVLRRQDLAEDATQSVFLILLGKARELECKGSLAPWLYVTSLRAAQGIARSERARRLRECASLPTLSPKTEAASELIGAIGKLGRLDQQVLLLRHVQGMTFAEVGDQLGLTQAAARMRLERAHSKLRQRLGGAFSLTALTATFSHEPTLGHSALPLPCSNSIRFASSKGVLLMQTLFRITTTIVCLYCLGLLYGVSPASGPSHASFPFVHAGIPDFGTPTGSYRLTYSYQQSLRGDRAATQKGTVTVTEASGALMIQSIDNDATTSVVFANGRTLQSRTPRHRAETDPSRSGIVYRDGFATGNGVTALRLPFNFQSVPIYRPLQERIDEVLSHDRSPSQKTTDQIRRTLTNPKSNVALFADPLVDKQGLVEGEFTSSGSVSTLQIGSKPFNRVSFRYSSPITKMGVTVPQQVEMVVYDHVGVTAGSAQEYRLQLESVETDPTKIVKPSPETILSNGQHVNYKGYDHKAFGIRFDSKETLDAQVTALFDSYRKLLNSGTTTHKGW